MVRWLSEGKDSYGKDTFDFPTGPTSTAAIFLQSNLFFQWLLHLSIHSIYVTEAEQDDGIPPIFVKKILLLGKWNQMMVTRWSCAQICW